MQIRKITRKDQKFITGLLQDFAKRDDTFSRMISGDMVEATEGTKDAESKAVLIGIKMLKTLLDTYEEKMVPWFADLCGLTLDAYEELPFGVDVAVINAIVESKEADDFFTEALRMRNLMSGLSAKFRKPTTT